MNPTLTHKEQHPYINNLKAHPDTHSRTQTAISIPDVANLTADKPLGLVPV